MPFLVGHRPPIRRSARWGLTQQGARQKGIQVRTGMTDVPSTTRGWIHKAGNDGLIKVVEDVDRRVLVGATVVAPAGGEILGALTVAVHAQVPTTSCGR